MNPLRALMGGTSRAHHLRLNKYVGLLMFGGALYQPWLAVSALSCLATEQLCSPDNDLSKRGYWALYGEMGEMAPHRSRFSHSLLLGLPLRILYGLPWLWIPVLLLALHSPSHWLATAAIYAGIGCVISDVAHYCLDSIPPWRWLAGKL